MSILTMDGTSLLSCSPRRAVVQRSDSFGQLCLYVAGKSAHRRQQRIVHRDGAKLCRWRRGRESTSKLSENYLVAELAVTVLIANLYFLDKSRQHEIKLAVKVPPSLRKKLRASIRSGIAGYVEE